MRPSVHFVVSLILAAIFYPYFNWQVLFIIIGGVLIDIDHYFWYIFRFRKLSILDCYNYHLTGTKKNNFKDVKGSLMIFHTIEFFLINALFSLYSDFGIMLTIGLLFHYILDAIERYRSTRSFITSPSIILWLIKNKIQKV
ncbi:hypothetical protein HYV80_04110 [Candidatus Woesearchaeota archaeon]|nr:hypothetical protein [Candidatus Woesearchaeota archaeon]